MATSTHSGDHVFQGTCTFAGGVTTTWNRSQLTQENEALYVVPLRNLMVWDSDGTPLPTGGNLEAAVTPVSFAWDPNVADATFFVANRNYRVLAITARVEVAGTDAGAVTATIKKAASGTDIASGTALHSSTIDLKGTVDTNQVLTLSATSSDLDIASGTSIGFDLTGTPTAARGCVTALLAPAASADDLRIVNGTFGTAATTVQTSDSKNTSVTQRARFRLALPPEYVTGETVKIRVFAGMDTTVASSSATVDIECYEFDGEGALGGLPTDLCETNAQSINSTTNASKDFTITSSGLAAGDMLDCRVTIAITDSATATAVIGEIGYIACVLDIKG